MPEWTWAGSPVLATALSFGAGLLTALSPCVLPALPIVVGSATAAHRHGPLALATGMTASFTAVGLALSAAGSVAGLSESGLRMLAASMLVGAGVLMFATPLQNLTSRLLSPLASAASRLANATGGGLTGQFAVGTLLGGVWSPCAGPTLGAAIGLASTGDSMARASMMMAAFGLGSSLPLVATAYAARHLLRRRGRLLAAGALAKPVFGFALVVMGAFVMTGTDKLVEAALLARLPQWWIDLLAGV